MRLATVPSEEGADAGGPVTDVRQPAAAATAEPLPGGAGLPVRGNAGWPTAGGRYAAGPGDGRSPATGGAPALGRRRAPRRDLHGARLQPGDPLPLADALRGGRPRSPRRSAADRLGRATCRPPSSG